MSIEEKFEKAVNVIRNLPKHGTYQPSHELQLRFYAFYKQASEGPNRQTRPNFWEVVKKAKWDAWNKLGNMSKEDAMVKYVDELRKIVETMAYTDNVESFLNSLDDFYENVPPEDIDLLVGPVIKKIRSNPNSPLSGSPLGSRDTSPNRPLSSSTPLHLITGSLETSPASSYSASPPPTETDDEDDDHFLDAKPEPDNANKGAVKKPRPEKTTSKRSVTRNVTPDRSYLLRVGAAGPVADNEDSVGPSSESSEPRYTNISSSTSTLQLESDSGNNGAVKKTRQEKTASKRSVTRNVTPDRSYLLRVGATVQGDSADNEYSTGSSRDTDAHAKTDLQKKETLQDIALRESLENQVAGDEYEDSVGPSSESSDPTIANRRSSTATLQKKVSFEGIPLHRCQAKTSLLEPSTVTFQRAISNLTKEMELLQRRTAMLESIHLDETTAGTSNHGVPLPNWWSLSPPTTAVVILWPVIVFLMARWLSSRRRQ